MNQAIQFNGVLDGCSTRKDKSLGLRVDTGELTVEEKMAVLQLQDIPSKITFEPLEGYSVTKEIKTELAKKTQSERIRGVLFCWWSHLGEPGVFDSFYNAETEKFINQIKVKLPPQ